MTLSAVDFSFVSALLRQDAAIVLDPGKEYLVEARLLPLAREAGMCTVSAYIARARHDSGGTTRQHIVDALTTNETSFFRDGEPFTALVETVLPALLRTRAATRHLTIWSAACASGQEPYSIAMLLADALPAGWTFEILGTDICTQMLARAQAGTFSQLEVNRGLSASMLVRHFQRDGAGWRVDERLRRSVTFRRLNLAAPMPSLGSFDIVFLRNVLIYFDLPTKQSVLDRVSAVLPPDGWLVLGSAETTIGVHDGFARVVTGRTSMYRPRVGARTAGRDVAVPRDARVAAAVESGSAAPPSVDVLAALLDTALDPSIDVSLNAAGRG